MKSKSKKAVNVSRETVLTNNYRQGDVGIFGSADLLKMPKDLNYKRVQSHIVAYGEVTGHKHELIADPACEMDVRISIAEDSTGGNLFVKVEGGNALLKHEEHHTITLAPGDYRMYIQREYDPAEYQRKVRD